VELFYNSLLFTIWTIECNMEQNVISLCTLHHDSTFLQALFIVRKKAKRAAPSESYFAT